MQYEGIDEVVVTLPDAAGSAPFERLGLCLTAPEQLRDSGVEFRMASAGDRENLFSIVLTRLVDATLAKQSWQGRLLYAGQGGPPGLRVLVLRVPSMWQAFKELTDHGVDLKVEELFYADGSKLGYVAALPQPSEAVVPLVLIERVRATADRHDEFEKAGLLAHSLKLKRLDHLAAAAGTNFEETTKFWVDVLGIPVWGEIVTATTVIRQMKIGDAIVELLGPAGPDSPLHSRPPGLSSMTAFEVPDLEEAVATARAAGFTISDPATGALPGTRVARIAADELSGLGLQLLQYV